MIINFFGDFFTPDTLPQFGDDLEKLIKDSDYNVINVEAPCIRSNYHKHIKKSGSILHQSIRVPVFLKNNGFNVFALANNHLMDYGEDAAKETAEYFGDQIVGIGNSKDAFSPLIVQKDNITVAFLNVTHQEFGAISSSQYDNSNYGVAWISDPNLPNIIHELSKKVNHVIIVSHAGVEHIEQPLPEWRDLYRSFINAGAHAVVASHPHIPQGWEIYNNAPIVYSLGNFYFPSSKKHSETWYWSTCARLELSKNSIGMQIRQLEFAADIIDVSSSSEFTEYLQRVNNVLADSKSYLSYIEQACDRLLPLYIGALAIGGWEGVYSPILFLKRFIKIMIKRGDYIPTHLINNLRCESHRWAIARALKKKLNVL